MDKTGADVAITTCAGDEYAIALELVFSALPDAERHAMVSQLAQVAASQHVDTRGLLVARRGSQPVGAVWAQTQPGNTAVLWPPGCRTGAWDPVVARQLMDAADALLAASGVTMAQVASKDCPAHVRDVLAGGGYEHLADLLYLARPTESPSDAPDSFADSALTFEPFDPNQSSRLEAMIEATYEATQDCPALNGLRSLPDIVAGYQATGVFSADRWMIAVHQQQDVGVLLLTDHPGTDSWELIYMGVAPQWRGRGWGMSIVQHAIALACYWGRARLVLAVDAVNKPAIAMYEACGFTAWDRREILLKQYS